MKKRLLATLLCIAMLSSLMAVGAAADEEILAGTCGENAYWSFDSDTGTLSISGHGEMYDYDELSDVPYIHLMQNKKVRNVVVGDKITHIGSYAFYEIQNSFWGYYDVLESVTIGKSVKTLGDCAISSEEIDSLVFPYGVTEIGYGNAISPEGTITVPSTVTKIGTYYDKISINEHTEQFVSYSGAFARCKAIIVEDGNNRYFSHDGVLYEKCSNGKYNLLYYPEGKTDASYSVISNTQEIVMYAFLRNDYISQIIMPSSLKRIGMEAFIGCDSLSDVQLNAGLEKIFASAFWNCVSLTRLDIPASVNYFAEEYVGLNGLESEMPQQPNLDIYFYGSTAPVVFNAGITAVYTNHQVGWDKTYVTIYYPESSTGWDQYIEEYDDYQWTLINQDGTVEGLDFLNFEPWNPGPVLPQIVELSPADGTSISETATTDFMITYDTPISATSADNVWYFPELDFSKGTIEIRRASDDALIYSVEEDPFINELYDIEGIYSGDVKVENSNTLLIQPFNVHTLFDAEEEYYVTIPAGFFTFENGATNEAVEKGEWTISTFENEPSTDEDGEGFTLGRDTLNGYNIFDDGILSDEHRALLKSKIPLWEKLLLKQAYQLNASQESLGLCFGMTAIMALIYDGRLKASDLQEGAKTAFDLDLSNPTVKSWVAYYNLTQFFEPVKSSDTWMEGMHPRGREQQLIKVLKDNQIAIVGLDFKAPGFVNAGHAVLAYDLDEESDPENYIVYFADPSSLAKAGHACPPGVLLINKVSYEANAYYSYHLVNETLYEDHDFIGLNSVIYDFSVFDKFISKSVSSGAGGAVKAATLNQNSYIEVNTSSSNFRIDIGNQYAVISGCKKVSGELDVVGPLVTLAGGNDSSTHAYRIYNASVEEVKISYSDEECHSTGIAFSSSEYTSTVSSYATEIVVKSTGDISVKNGRGTSEIATVAGSNFAPNLAIQAKLNISNFALKVNSSEVQITSGESLGNITVSGLSDWDAVTIDCTTDGRTVSITESTTPNMGKLLTVTDESSAVIGRAGITNTVVFISNGGSFVDAQSGISYGGKAVCPVNPTKAGYVFGGWYKDEALTEPWNFNVDVVTEYTWLYAKWLDESTLPEEPSNPNWPSIDIPSHQPIEPDEPAETLPFTDVSVSDSFYDYVTYVYANGLMDGVSATEFNPNGTMTRAMVWAILARIDGETVTGANWAAAARTWAMTSGVSDGTDPNGLVTREQFVTMLWRYAGEPASTYSLEAYTDASGGNEWAQTAMQWAVENGIITGVTSTTLEPQGTATRAQAAAMLMRYVENIK